MATPAHALRLARLIGLAARATRLATDDTITEPARRALLNRVQFTPAQRTALANEESIPLPDNMRAAQARLWAADLLTCRWCLGFWISATVVAADARWGHTRWFQATADTALASYALGWLAQHEGAD